MLSDLSGASFGELVVVERGHNAPDGSAQWRCLCSCGESRIIRGTALRAGRNRSCGCKSPRFTSAASTTHGMSGTRVYGIWLGMHQRCSPAATGKSRRLYYAKGIRVCERWASFDLFFSDMGAPGPSLTLDRINGALGYAPENCRWATRIQQANNTAANKRVTAAGATHTVAEWSRLTGHKSNTIVWRLLRGWPGDEAVGIAGRVCARAQTKHARRRDCVVCGAPFLPRTSQVRAGVGLTCSQKCNGTRALWKVRKVDELDALSSTVRELMERQT